MSDLYSQPGLNDLLTMPRQCGWCGIIHGPMCPRVKAIECYPDGTVKRVEFHENMPRLQRGPCREPTENR